MRRTYGSYNYMCWEQARLDQFWSERHLRVQTGKEFEVACLYCGDKFRIGPESEELLYCEYCRRGIDKEGQRILEHERRIIMGNLGAFRKRGD